MKDQPIPPGMHRFTDANGPDEPPLSPTGPQGVIGNVGIQCHGAVGTYQLGPTGPEGLPGLQGHDIGWALNSLKDGKPVRREHWSQGMHLAVADNHVCIHLVDGRELVWVVSLDDLRAEDWVR